MTNVLHVHGQNTIWSLTDRRLSKSGRPVKEDGRKVMFLESIQGVAILAYAGLGATARGTEPSDWMSAVLRGFTGAPLEYLLGVLAEAMKKEIPRHINRLIPAHDVVISAFMDGEVRPRVYTIGLFSPRPGSWLFGYTQRQIKPNVAPWVVMAGSGTEYLLQNKNKWKPELSQLVRWSNRGKVSPDIVADYLARLNNEVHSNLTKLKNQTVGPRCIVAWRHGKRGKYGGGGSQLYYNGARRDEILYNSRAPQKPSTMVPTIANGMDVNAIVGVMMEGISESLAAGKDPLSGDLLFSTEEMNKRLARLPGPDDRLI